MNKLWDHKKEAFELSFEEFLNGMKLEASPHPQVHLHFGFTIEILCHSHLEF